MTLALKSDGDTLTAAEWNAVRNPSNQNIDARDYGATGNGSTDDTASIQNAINALHASGGILFLAPGTYRITSAIVVARDQVNKLIIRGAGTNTTLIRQDGAGVNGITIGANCNVDFSDFTLQLPATGSTGHGMEFQGSGETGWYRSNIARITIFNCDATHYGITTTNLGWCSIRDVRLNAVGNGLRLLNDHPSLNWGNSVFENVAIDMIGAGIGLNIVGTSGLMNLNNFVRLHINSNAYAAGSTGVKCDVGARHNQFYGFNVEAMDTAFDVADLGNAFKGGYASASGDTNGGIYCRATSGYCLFEDFNFSHGNGGNLSTAIVDTAAGASTSNIFANIHLGAWHTDYSVTATTIFWAVQSFTAATTYLMFQGKLLADLDLNSNDILNAKTLQIKNTGTGTNPVLSSASGANNLALTGGFIVNPSTTPSQALTLDMASLGSAGLRNSHQRQIVAKSFDTSSHEIDWREFVNADTQAGNSTMRWQNRVDAASFQDMMTLNHEGYLTLGAVKCTGTTHAFLPPQMTTAQRDALGFVTGGSIIFNTDLNKLQVIVSNVWVSLN